MLDKMVDYEPIDLHQFCIKLSFEATGIKLLGSITIIVSLNRSPYGNRLVSKTVLIGAHIPGSA